MITIAALVVLVVASAGLALYVVSNPPAPQVQPGKITVAAIGDSNTYGYGVLFDDRGAHSYPAQLQKLLGPDYQVLNYGLVGRTLVAHGDQPYTKESFFRRSQRIHPDIVLIMLGTNDSKPQNWNADEYEANLRTFAATYQKLSNHPDVYLLTPPAAYKNNFDVRPAIVADEVVSTVGRVGAAMRLPVIDIYSATARCPLLFPDGVHPGATGYRLIATTVARELNHPAAAAAVSKESP